MNTKNKNTATKVANELTAMAAQLAADATAAIEVVKDRIANAHPTRLGQAMQQNFRLANTASMRIAIAHRATKEMEFAANGGGEFGTMRHAPEATKALRTIGGLERYLDELRNQVMEAATRIPNSTCNATVEAELTKNAERATMCETLARYLKDAQDMIAELSQRTPTANPLDD